MVYFLFLYVCDQWQGVAKWIKTEEEYFVGLTVPANREEIGDSLDKYSVNCDISPD